MPILSYTISCFVLTSGPGISCPSWLILLPNSAYKLSQWSHPRGVWLVSGHVQVCITFRDFYHTMLVLHAVFEV